MKRLANTNRHPAHRKKALALLLCALVGGAAVVQACNVPVFRYALERWHPDPYRATLFHRGPLSEAQQALLRPLEPASDKASDKLPANVALRTIDVDTIEEEADRTLWAAQSGAELPWLAVQYPQSLRNDKSVCAVPLSEAGIGRLIDSPLRSELARRLADGQTAVWLLLESGQAEKDDAVAAQLTDELERLSHKLKLPELTEAPQDNLLSDAPLKVTFSLLRLPRGAEAEQPLVQMLLGSEPDLADLAEPMVFPVFGRGRALLPLIGAGITADNIHESAAFLVGACSCEIKDLNPGFDLLLAADWDVLLFKESPPADVVAARTKVASGKPELVAIPVGATTTTFTPTSDTSPSPEASSETEKPSSYAASMAVVGLLLAAMVVVAFKRFV